MADYVDFTPTLFGQPVEIEADEYDDETAYVAVIELFDDPGRDDYDGGVFAEATVRRLMPFVYRFTFTEPLTPGRYWTTVTWTPADAGDQQSTDGRVDLPSDPTTVCSVEDVAVRLGVTLPVTATQREMIGDRIREAQADVEGYLNRPLVAVARTLAGVWPQPPYDLTDYRAWPVAQFDDFVEVLGAALNDDSTYDVSVLVGLDGRRDPSVVRYVTAHAVETLRNDPSSGMGTHAVSSVSADGQSVSYADVSTATMTSNAGQPGSVPNIKTLSRLRRMAVYRRPTGHREPWPYGFGAPLYRVS